MDTYTKAIVYCERMRVQNTYTWIHLYQGYCEKMHACIVYFIYTYTIDFVRIDHNKE